MKPIHERLKEYAKNYNDRLEIQEVEGVDTLAEFLEKIAKEIKTDYIPRPRFEDGEPVDFGTNELEWADTDNYNPQTPWRVTAISQEGVPLATAGDKVVARAAMTDGKLVKRPTPKVYDADGVEIKVGESLYNPQGYIFEVRSIEGDEDEWLVWCGETKCGIKVCYKADECTHERPVFDAEGERIKVGDMVWNINTGDQHYIVLGISPSDGSCKIVEVENQDGTFNYFAHDKLTHREPDSIQKLNEELCSKHDWHEMSRDDLGAKEYIACLDYDRNLYAVYLDADEEIIRCRDCDRSRENGWKCTRWATGHWDEDQEVDVIELADVKPDGFCFNAERNDA